MSRREVLYRVSRREDWANLNHPLVDAVVVSVRWSDLERTRGRLSTAEIRSDVQRWRDAGKAVNLRFIPFGDEDRATPEWVYRELPRIEIGGGGSIPYVLRERYQSMLAGVLNGLATVGATGHLVSVGWNGSGNVACPDRVGARALIAAGWTPAQWAHHAGTVREQYLGMNVPLLATCALLTLRDGGTNHAATAEALVDAHHRAGVTTISLGLESKREDMVQTVARIERLKQAKGASVFLADDWPLWTEPGPRRKAKPTLGRGDEDFAASLKLAAGLGAAGLMIQAPECEAANPTSGAAFVPAVHAALKKFRTNDARTKE